VVCAKKQRERTARRAQSAERIFAAVGVALFKVTFYLGHSIGHVGQADDRHLPRLGKGVEGGGFHFHGEHVLLGRGTDGLNGFTEGRVGCPDSAA